jgi:hypothetical protein
LESQRWICPGCKMEIKKGEPFHGHHGKGVRWHSRCWEIRVFVRTSRCHPLSQKVSKSGS